jgi:hypothetical protein
LVVLDFGVAESITCGLFQLAAWHQTAAHALSACP